MKNILMFVCLLSGPVALAQVGEVIVENASLQTVLNAVLDSLALPPAQKGGLVVIIDDLTDSTNVFYKKKDVSFFVEVFFETERSRLLYNLPLFYTIHRDRAVFIYTGFEALFDYPRQAREKIRSEIIRSLPEYGRYLNSHWYWQVVGDKVKFISRVGESGKNNR